MAGSLAPVPKAGFVVRLRDWRWRGWSIRYGFAGSGSPPLVFVHGFGVNGGHWRHNWPFFAQQRRTYVVDLLGFGATEKPPLGLNTALWAAQLQGFAREVVGQPAVWVGNSVGSLASLRAIAPDPEGACGWVALSIPDVGRLRQGIPSWLQPWQQVLEGEVGALLAAPLLALLRQPATIRRVLLGTVYGDKAAIAVDAELVELIAKPARERRAARTLAYLCRGQARDATDATALLQTLSSQRPTLMLWGTRDR
ncbi:MAG: alpha/beta fold hydrolase [Oscillatoriales cyanobacterium SM2_1_8]|nr:alpha/beta fold hydrolase [Oscillatoriales cyanobacterium SM2_1_8]